MPLKVTILGSGTSTGVPVIGCDCAICQSTDPKNNRLRSSILLEDQDTQETILVDTTPDLRQQALRAKLKQLDTVFYTHTHADHCNGFDDLRMFFFKRKKPIECWLLTEHIAEIKQRFFYAFQETGYLGTVPQIKLKTYENAPLRLGKTLIEYAVLPHGHMNTACFKFGNFCYATDFKSFPEEVVQRWKGRIHTMVASGLRFKDHLTHSTIPETLHLFERLGVKKGIITHLSHDVDHLKDCSHLPTNVSFGYDGMIIDVNPS